MLEDETPHVVVGTPGRVIDLVERKSLKCNKVKRFVLDECDSLLEANSMRDQVQRIFRACPHEKQVMMFTATLGKGIKSVAQKFCVDPVEVIPEESKLTLHGLQQFYVKITEAQKNRKLHDLLKKLEFNQVIIFVSGTSRCKSLHKLLVDLNFPSNAIYGSMEQKDRMEQYNLFKEYKSRILVATDVFARGVDFEKVNIVFNYDMPSSADTYLHRVGRSGRFGTKGLAITFAASSEDSATLEEVQSRFEVEVPTLPDEIDTTSYMS
jgi:ATP-dependent RNA helicase UAP56/SUB2